MGLKGHRIGHAEISARHADCIVNGGGATSSEVLACIRLAWETVRAERGVNLGPDIDVLGDWNGRWPLA